MLTSTFLNQSFALIQKDDEITLYQGQLLRFDKIDDLQRFYKGIDTPLIFLTPFSVVREKGFKVIGDEKILVLKVAHHQQVDPNELSEIMDSQSIELENLMM